MRDRNACIRRRGDCRSDARDHLEWDSRFDQHLALFATAPEDEGVAAFQADHAFAGFRFLHQ